MSSDLTHWQEQEVAIGIGADNVAIFSGSAVIDYHNTSGFQPATSLQPAYVAIYTGMAGDNSFQD